MSKLLDALTELGKQDRGEVDPMGSFYPDHTPQPIVALTIISHIPQMSCKTRALRMTETFVSRASRHQPHEFNKQGIWIAGVNEQLQQAGADAFNRFQRCARATMISPDPIVGVSCRLSGFLGESTTSTKRCCIQIPSPFTILAFHSCLHDRNVLFVSCGLASTRRDNLGAQLLFWHPCSNSVIV